MVTRIWLGASPNGDAYPGGGGQVPQPGSDTDKDKDKEADAISKKFFEWSWKSVGWYRNSLVWLATAILAIFFLRWSFTAGVVLTVFEMVTLVIALLGMALTIVFGVIGWHAAAKWAQAAANESDPTVTNPNEKIHWHNEKLKWHKTKHNCDQTILITFLTGIVALTLYVLGRLL